MHIILLSGGEGKRLYPLSNNVQSKQFLRVLRAPTGGVESMLQRVVRQIRESGLECDLTVATGAAQVDIIRSQLGDDVSIVAEPSRRDTFPAIALAATYLVLEKGYSRDDSVVVMPCDPYTDQEYFSTIDRMRLATENNVADLILMGIRPTYPSTKFGYVVPAESSESDTELYRVARFTEKPDETQAAALIAQGAFWNGGVFTFRLGYILDIVERYVQYKDFANVRQHYDFLPKISFDYEVAEKATSVAVVPFDGEWKDLGTWNALSEQLPERISGKGFVDTRSTNTHIVNGLDIPVLCIGAQNLIIATSPDGILVCDKSSSEYIKDYVDKVACRHPMYEERMWGEYQVLNTATFPKGRHVLVKRIKVNSGKSTRYHAHHDREEIWTFIHGKGELVLDGERKIVSEGESVVIPKDTKHVITAISELIFIKVQFIDELT